VRSSKTPQVTVPFKRLIDLHGGCAQEVGG
jgi:hypothetical protein